MFILFLAIAAIAILILLNAIYQAGRNRGIVEGVKLGRHIEQNPEDDMAKFLRDLEERDRRSGYDGYESR